MVGLLAHEQHRWLDFKKRGGRIYLKGEIFLPTQKGEPPITINIELSTSIKEARRLKKAILGPSRKQAEKTLFSAIEEGVLRLIAWTEPRPRGRAARLQFFISRLKSISPAVWILSKAS